MTRSSFKFRGLIGIMVTTAFIKATVEFLESLTPSDKRQAITILLFFLINKLRKS